MVEKDQTVAFSLLSPPPSPIPLQTHKSDVFHSRRQVQNTYNFIHYLHNRIQTSWLFIRKVYFFPLKQCRYATHCTKDTLFKPAFALQLKPESKPFLQSFLLLDFIPQVDSANTIFNCKFTGCVLDCGTEQEKQVPSFYLVSWGKQV